MTGQVDEAITPEAPPAAIQSDISDYRAGDVIGEKYVLTKLLGFGGMGSVWSARNDVLEIDVAIKFLRTSGMLAGGAERFLQEARAAAKIGHPSIVRVLDYGGFENTSPYLVMELLDGPSLGDILESRKRIPAIEAVQLILPLCGALEAAHQKGIVHRDLKPDNVIVVRGDDENAVPKLVDFGIVKVVNQVSGTKSRPLTCDGSIIGTPDYMSPEQARGLVDVDRRSDVWGITVMLYEMIAGELPFRQENQLALLQSILSDEPKPTTELGVGDAELWAILHRGLTKDPAHRWQTMRQLGQTLAAWCIARGADIDCAGASLSAHWVRDRSGTLTPRSLPQSSVSTITAVATTGGRPSMRAVDSQLTRSAPPRASAIPWPALAGFAVAVACLGGWLTLRAHSSAQISSATSPPAAAIVSVDHADAMPPARPSATLDAAESKPAPVASTATVDAGKNGTTKHVARPVTSPASSALVVAKPAPTPAPKSDGEMPMPTEAPFLAPFELPLFYRGSVTRPMNSTTLCLVSTIANT